MNLGDPEFELIDPTPDIYALFVNFDKTFFWSQLESRTVVRWSKRMYSCAGICSYSGRSGLCDIALSEPLLKLRPRKDLIETLLHEMIHAYLFVTHQYQDRDGHGPNFKSHMHRINKSTGLNISIYHSFHDEVEVYQTHWWRCNGPCQYQRPRFGIVRRTNNRAPGPSDWWWSRHQKLCRGTFVKIKEPENYVKKGAAKTNRVTSDITKFVTSNTASTVIKPVLKDFNSITTQTNVKAKSNSSSTVVVNKKGVLFNPQFVKPTKPGTFNGEGHVLSDNKRSTLVNVHELVRNVWANKQFLTPPAKNKSTIEGGTANRSKNKQHTKFEHPDAPKNKIPKIDDFFKTNARSVLKDVYGNDFEVKSSSDGKKLVAEVKIFATTSKVVNGAQNLNINNRQTQESSQNLVDCPVCSAKVDNEIINRHLDGCLNKEVIENLNKESIQVSNSVNNEINSLLKPKQNIWQDIPKFDINNSEIKFEIPESLDLSFGDELLDKNHKVPSYINSQITNNSEEKNACSSKVVSDFMKKTEPAAFLNETYNDISNEDFKAKKDINKLKTEKGEPILIKVEDEVNQEQISNINEENMNTTGKCLCCGNETNISIDQHLEECLMFFDNNNTVPKEGANIIDTIVLDDEDDNFDETLTLNATGTKLPCPCCLKMIEQADMNNHLDVCLIVN